MGSNKSIICRQDDLELRVLEIEDAAALQALTHNYTSYRVGWLYRGTAEEFINSSLERYHSNQGFWAGVWWQHQLAGAIGLNEVNHENRSANIDYMLGGNFRGKGLMTRAVVLLASYCFSALDLHRLEIQVDPENVKSVAVAERAGFVREGILRQKIDYGDTFGDLAIYAALSSEWVTWIGSVTA